MARNRQIISGVLRELQNYSENAKQAAIEGLFESGDIVAEEAKKLCPVDTGRLSDSIHTIKKDAKKVRVIADAKNPKDGYYYGSLIEYSPKKGKAFLRPALELKREDIRQHVKNKIRDALNQI